MLNTNLHTAPTGLIFQPEYRKMDDSFLRYGALCYYFL